MLSERRRPVGVIGANFEARPNVVVDIASQLVKSRNAGVLRTGSAALRSAIALADEVIAPVAGRGGPRPGRDPADPGARPGRRVRAGPRAEADPAGHPARQRRLHPGAGRRGGGARGPHAGARRRRRGALHSLVGRTGGGLVADRAAASTGSACATGSTCCSSTSSCGTRGCRRSPGSWPGSASRPRCRRTTTRSATSGRSTPSARPRSPSRRPAARPQAAAIANDADLRPGGGHRRRRRRRRPAEFLAAYAGTGAFWNATTRLLDGFKLLRGAGDRDQPRRGARPARSGDLPRPVACASSCASQPCADLT